MYERVEAEGLMVPGARVTNCGVAGLSLGGKWCQLISDEIQQPLLIDLRRRLCEAILIRLQADFHISRPDWVWSAIT